MEANNDLYAYEKNVIGVYLIPGVNVYGLMHHFNYINCDKTYTDKNEILKTRFCTY